MAVSCTAQDREMRAAISGEVDHHAAKAIMAELERQIGAGLPRRLTLDLGGVTFMDSSGIAVVLRARQRMGALGGVVTVANTPTQAGKVLRAAGLERLVQFV